jgi:hydrogenase nickel incorporation protein HypA/HybF
MHEMSICQALLNQVQQVVQQHQAQHATRIKVEIGPLAGVEPNLLAQAFSIAKIGTIAEHAALNLVTAPITVRCRECQAESEVAVNRLLCQQCGSWQTQLLTGDELILASVELAK